jgi:glycosyltransferase involved in cell wall biosynthesis
MSPPTLSDYAEYARNRLTGPGLTPNPPLVSVITVSLNAASTIERTIRSVQGQSFSSIEHIFVDGGSNDDTLAIIKGLARQQDYRISEPDKGISDAFNKGVALSQGTFVQILNADDWLSPDQIERAVGALQRTQAEFVFGNLIFYEHDKPAFRYAGDPHYARAIHRRWPSVAHPTMLVARRAFERIGLFDPAYRNAMDYDWLLRLHRSGGRGVYCPELFAHMNHDGVSNRAFARTIDEVKRIVIAHGRNPLVAEAEASMRHVKTRAAQPLKRHLRPLYRLVRRMINPSFRPISVSN